MHSNSGALQHCNLVEQQTTTCVIDETKLLGSYFPPLRACRSMYRGKEYRARGVKEHQYHKIRNMRERETNLETLPCSDGPDHLLDLAALVERS